MAPVCRVVLRLILVVASMGIVSVSGWDLWDSWYSMENDSVPLDGLGISSGGPENEQTSDPLGSTTYQLDTGSGFDDQSTTVSDYFPDVYDNDTFSGSDEGIGEQTEGEESKGFLQKTMDFFSKLLSPSGTDDSNSTETDNFQPNDYESDLCIDGNTSENCSSDSVTQDQQLPEDSFYTELQEPDGDYPLTSSTDTPTPAATSEVGPTWLDASASCIRESIDRNVGNCNWEEERTLEGALLDVFNDTVVKRLAKKCMPGEWCLHKHFSKHQTQAVQRSCHLLSCLDDWKDDNCQPSNVIWNALNLLCTLTNANTSDVCFSSVLKMTHVTITDMIRVAVQPEDEESLCSKGEDKEGCTGPCEKAGQNLRCMSSSCDNNTALFEGFAEWQWLFGKSDAVEKCHFNSSDCLLFETHFMMTSHDNDVLPYHSPRHLLTFLKNTEWSVAAGLCLSVFFSLVVVCGIFLGLRCSGRRRLRQRILRQKAMTRDDGGFTRDRIQYTIINTQQDDFYDQDSDDMT